MKAVHKARLLKLATHLETGKLGHKKFAFSYSNVNVTKGGLVVDAEPYSCGTAGCAIGECPIIFPRRWHFDNRGNPALRGTDFGRFLASPGIDFGLDDEESTWLFVPDSPWSFNYAAPWNKKHLTKTATRKQVAASIRRFVAWKEQQVSA